MFSEQSKRECVGLHVQREVRILGLLSMTTTLPSLLHYTDRERESAWGS